MPKYLFQASYTAEGAKGLLRDGGTRRRAAVEEVAKSQGGKLESFYYMFGEDDAIGVLEMPDHAAICAISVAVNASGFFRLKTSVLITPEEVDAATRKSVSYRAPGS
jgi:uncharacterized protein with GYD domain